MAFDSLSGDLVLSPWGSRPQTRPSIGGELEVQCNRYEGITLGKEADS